MDLIGVLIGAISGAVQLYLLILFVNRVTHGNFQEGAVVTILLGLAQLFVPLAVLLCGAFLFREALLYTGLSIAAVLIVGSVIRSVLLIKRGNNGGADSD